MIRAAGIALALVFANVAAASALPGQALKAVCAWAKASPDLKSVNCATGGSEGENDFIFAYVKSPDVTVPGRVLEDNFLAFEAHPDASGAIQQEILRYHHLPDVPYMIYKRQGGRGLDAVRALFGVAVANDFVASTHVSDRDGVSVYRGKRFTYTVSSLRVNNPGGDVAHQVTIDDEFALTPLKR